jgi:large repetitive protein
MPQYLVNAVFPTSTYAKTLLVTGTNIVSEIGEGYYSPFTPGPVALSPPVPVASALMGGTVGTSYSETISAQGGTSPYSFAVTAGTLPIGTSLAGSTGVISGTPSAAGTFSFTITVTDASSTTGSQPFSIIVAASSSGGSSNYGYTA